MVTGGAVTTGRKIRWGLTDILVLVFALVPVLWVVSLSFKTKETLTDGNFIPQAWTFQNYADIFATTEFVRALVNSIGIAIIATVIAVVLGTMAAYAIARLDFRLSKPIHILIYQSRKQPCPPAHRKRRIQRFDEWPPALAAAADRARQRQRPGSIPIFGSNWCRCSAGPAKPSRKRKSRSPTG